MRKNSQLWLVLVSTTVFLTGCVKQTAVGEQQVFSYELWLPALAFTGGVVAGFAGWKFRKSQSGWRWVLLVGAPVAMLFFAPSLFLERAKVDQEGFQIRSGIFGATAAHDVRFADISQITLVSEESRGRRGRRVTNYFMVCQLKSGDSAKVPANNNVTEAAVAYILRLAAESGIPIINEIEE